MSDKYGLGPLPQADRNSELQRLSIRALQLALPVDKLLFRDERADDFGVDGSMEILEGGRATNLRAQVQLKSAEETAPNADGSISYSVKVSNLNYMLNGPSPLYVLYTADSGNVLYLWARDERLRIEREKLEWQTQTTVTLRFRMHMGPQAVEDIWSRIVREALLHRRLMDTLSGAEPKQSLSMEVDPERLTFQTDKEVEALLETSGFAIIAAGFPKEVVNLSRRLSSSALKESRFRLLVAYAEYRLGRYISAESHLVEAKLGRGQLDSSERLLLDLVANACEFETGRIDEATYKARDASLVASAPTWLQREHRFINAKQHYVREQQIEKRPAFLYEMRQLVAEAKADDNASASSKLELQVHLMEIEGEHRLAEFVNNVFQIRARQAIALPWARPDGQSLRDWETQWAEWQAEAHRLLQAAASSGNPLLFAQATLTEAVVRFHLLVQQRNSIAALPTGMPLQQEEQLYRLMAEVERVRGIYQKTDSIEDELRCILLLADMYAYLGNNSAARGLAEGVLPRAKVLRYQQLVTRAEEHIDGRWFGNRFGQQLSELKNLDEDALIAQLSERDLEDQAKYVRISLNLPQDRLPIIRLDAEAMRAAARERLHFCRHISIKQWREHVNSQDTMYAADPQRICVCEKYGYRSQVSNTDPFRLFSEFKNFACGKCAGREPKLSDVQVP